MMKRQAIAIANIYVPVKRRAELKPATVDELAEYWSSMVDTYIDAPSGIVTLRVRAFRAARDEPLARHARERLLESARREMNLMPAVIDAVKAGTTLGEISDTLRDVYGGHDPNA